VDFKSIEGTGTTFRFHIPAAGTVQKTNPEYAAKTVATPRAG
jgi:hypothetical protein